MTSPSIVLSLLAALACTHGAAVYSGRSQNPKVWPTQPMGGLLTIGREDAKRGEFPYQVSMQVSEQHICSGTILNMKWILTVAHCVKAVPENASAFILAGKTNLQAGEEGQQRRAVSMMYFSERFNTQQEYYGVNQYDIGLLKLQFRLVLSDTVRPAKLPKQYDAVFEGQATLTGWGIISTSQELVLSAQLQKHDLPIIEYGECWDWMNTTTENNPLIIDSNLCAGYLYKGGQGFCNGDSGAPLIQTDDNGDVVVIGAASWGFFPCLEAPALTVYTKVSSFIDWINETISKNK